MGTLAELIVASEVRYERSGDSCRVNRRSSERSGYVDSCKVNDERPPSLPPDPKRFFDFA